MKTFNYKNALGLLLIVAALSTACDNEYGLLASIQLETKESSNKLFVGAAAKDIVEFNGSYFAVTRAIYSRSTADGADWSLVSNSQFGEGYTCLGIATTSEPAIYAAILGSNDSMKGIFKKTSSTNWQLLSSGSTDVQGLFSVNNILFEMTRTTDTSTTPYTYSYNLLYWDGDSFETTGIAAADGPIVGGVYVGTNYWFAAGTSIYSGIVSSMAQVTSESDQPSGKVITSVAKNGTDIYFSTADRLVYRRENTPSWTVSSALSSTSTEKISSLAYLPTSSKVIAGMDTATGYFELASDVTQPAVYCTSLSALAPENYSANPLSDKPIVKLSLLGNKLFACVAAGNSKASALWRNDWDTTTSTWSGWTAE